MSQRRLPAEIYWRRRLLVLAVVIALVWIVLRLTGGDDEVEPKAGPTPTATATTAAPAPATVNGVVRVSLTSESRACDPEQVRMTPTVEPGQVTKGPVEIGLVVSSTEKAACTLTPADADLVAVISANGTAIWDSTLCKVSLLDEPVSISSDWASLVTTTWTGRGSGNDCSPKAGFATPGDYTVQVGTLGGEPGKTSFTLKAKPAPKPTKTTPTATKKTPAPPKGTTKPND